MTKRYEEPFSWDHRPSKAIHDLDFEPCRFENAVDQVLQLGPIDVVKLVCRKPPRHSPYQKRRLQMRAGDPLFDAHICDADLVHQFPVFCDERMI